MTILSIIIPTFNCSIKLRRVINNIKAYPEIEIIVIDDGSNNHESTRNKQICLSNKVRYFWIKNQGPSKARYEGLKKSKSKYVLFLDSDDTISLNAILFALKLFKDQESIDFITFKSQYVKDINILLPSVSNKITTSEKSKTITQLLIEIFGFPKQKTIGWNQSNTIYERNKILSIYSCRYLSWGEDIPLKIKIIRNLSGFSVNMSNASLIEVSYGRGYNYNFKQITNLAKEMYKLDESILISTISFISIYLRYIPSMIYKKVKIILRKK
ncbi:glycosyltransferase family A protein [Xenorhabdus bovienii]|uniref:glycosyltransferase family A protein n=1 Tax=Xenorhabdus bovienii TaxID=40576 RepID=UPI0023B25D58|nr:glycosyltransferase family 2 protein [Xenorhabdus bovienii]MDE9453840.1 glycosyltransferase family 2 protein [Xenorhabdus bovienii]